MQPLWIIQLYGAARGRRFVHGESYLEVLQVLSPRYRMLPVFFDAPEEHLHRFAGPKAFHAVGSDGRLDFRIESARDLAGLEQPTR